MACVCVCTLYGLNSEHKFRVWVTILGRMSRHLFKLCLCLHLSLRFCYCYTACSEYVTNSVYCLVLALKLCSHLTMYGNVLEVISSHLNRNPHDQDFRVMVEKNSHADFTC